MPVTLAQARVALRERLDENIARHWTDNQLDRWLYEGAKAIARTAEVLQTTATVTFADGVQEAALPADMVRLYRAVWRNDGDDTGYTLDYKDFNNADAVWWTGQTITQGTPTIYTMWGVPGSVKAVLYPTPSQDGAITIQYYKLPAVPTLETSVIDLPEGWEDVMYAHAEMRALKQDRDPRWQEAKAEYDEQLNNLITLTRRHTDQDGQQLMGSFPQVNGWLYEFG